MPERVYVRPMVGKTVDPFKNVPVGGFTGAATDSSKEPSSGAARAAAPRRKVRRA